MGLLRAFTGALSGTFADQWRDFLVPPDNMTETTALVAAVTKQGGSNVKGNQNIISNGSKIVVPEGMALVTVIDGKVKNIVTEPGGYIWRDGGENSNSVMAGDGLGSLVGQTGNRFTAGGQVTEQDGAFYVNLKEIPNNKFGTQSEIYWDDAYVNAQVGAMCRGTYTIQITNPQLFVLKYVPSSYLKVGSKPYDFADVDNESASQLFNEFVSSLAPAFSAYTNDPSKGNRMSKIQQDSIGLAKCLNQVVEDNYGWSAGRGLSIVRVAITSIEYDEDTKQLLKDVKAADALSGARGNSFMQQAVARGMQAAGQNGGGMGMAMLGMGMQAGGSVMQNVQQGQTGHIGMMQAPQPVQQPVQEDPYEKLAKLKGLLDQGVISQEEFDAAKAKTLGI